MERQAVILFVAPRAKKAFRLKCLTADHTMQSAVEWFITQVIEGQIKLPYKQVSRQEEK